LRAGPRPVTYVLPDGVDLENVSIRRFARKVQYRTTSYDRLTGRAGPPIISRLKGSQKQRFSSAKAHGQRGRTAVICWLASAWIVAGCGFVDTRINLADFARVVRFDGEGPRGLRAVELVRGEDGWPPYVDEGGEAWIGLEWDSPRVIVEAEIEFRHAVADRRLVHVEYFEHEPMADAGCGDRPCRDAFHGRWVTGRTDWWAGDRFVGFEFLPTAAGGSGDVSRQGYPVTSRLRFRLGKRNYELPPVRYIRVYGPESPREASLEVRLDRDSPLRWPLSVSVRNGVLVEQETTLTTRTATLDSDARMLRVRYNAEACRPNRTVVTLRMTDGTLRGFSFEPEEVVARGLIRVPALGVVVRHATAGKGRAPATGSVPGDSTSRPHISDKTSPDVRSGLEPSTSVPAAALPDKTMHGFAAIAPAGRAETVRTSNTVAVIRIPDPVVQACVDRTLADLCARGTGAKRVGPSVGEGTPGGPCSVDEWVAVVEALDAVGLADEARRLLDEVLAGQSRFALPGRFNGVDGALCVCETSDGQPRCSSCMDHAVVLTAAGDHYRLARDRFWLTRWADQLVAACGFVLRNMRGTGSENGAPCAVGSPGLWPPGSADGTDLWYSWLPAGAQAATGMQRVAEALADINHPDAPRLIRAADALFRQVAERSWEALRAHPVVRMGDGTYLPVQPPCMGFVDDCSRCGPDVVAPVRLIDCGIYAADSAEAGWILAKDASDSVQHGKAGMVLSRPAELVDLARLRVRLRRGERDEAVRLFHAALAATFRDGGNSVSSSKQAESASWDMLAGRAVCLLMLRHMLVDDSTDGLDILAGVPEVWLAPGVRIEAAGLPTTHGPVNLLVVATSGGGEVTIEISGARRDPPARWRVHLPGRRLISRVMCNGFPISTFDPGRGTVTIERPAGRIRLVISY